MSAGEAHDAVVIGSGPNGLAAAIELARNGKSVVVYEAAEDPGGGCRTAELTRPGFLHDVCSAIHPLAFASPFFQSIPLEQLGVVGIHPSIPLAHPLDDGSAAALYRSLEETAEGLGVDGRAYTELMSPFTRHAEGLIYDVLGPLRPPRHPITLARFGLKALHSVAGLARSTFTEEKALAILAGIAAHSMLPLTKAPTAGFGLLLAVIAHSYGWPMIEGGSRNIALALVRYLRALGGEVITGAPVTNMRELPDARAYLFDLGPKQVIEIAGDRLPPGYVRRLRGYRYGPGVFKVDYALDGPIPWKAEECGRAGTVHLGGSLSELTASEQTVTNGRHSDRPYVLLAQHSLFDPSRAPEGKHTVWAYCHVPAGSTRDMTAVVDAQVERFAPGFTDLVLDRHTMTASDYETYNGNYVGGDINVGLQDLLQTLTRPVARLDPYGTPNKSIYFCSSATPPGGGVHGMCGYHAARSALRRSF